MHMEAFNCAGAAHVEELVMYDRVHECCGGKRSMAGQLLAWLNWWLEGPGRKLQVTHLGACVISAVWLGHTPAECMHGNQ